MLAGNDDLLFEKEGNEVVFAEPDQHADVNASMHANVEEVETSVDDRDALPVMPTLVNRLTTFFLNLSLGCIVLS